MKQDAEKNVASKQFNGKQGFKELQKKSDFSKTTQPFHHNTNTYYDKENDPFHAKDKKCHPSGQDQIQARGGTNDT